MAAPPVNHRKRELFNMNPFLVSTCQTRTSVAGFPSAAAAIAGLALCQQAVLVSGARGVVVLGLTAVLAQVMQGLASAVPRRFAPVNR
jgi:hypothetical protein